MPSLRSRFLNWLPVLLVLLAFLALRLPGLGRFITTDEALWLRRSANFRLALHQQDWPSTFQSPHPGVLTQWAGAAAYQIVFPDYARLGAPDIRDPDLLRLLENRGVSPMRILAVGRGLLLALHAAALVAACIFAARLLGPWAAAVGGGLLALDPFLAGHQRLLHLDGLLASLIPLAVLAFLDFLKTRQPGSLLAAGLATGLAWLTKTPAIFLLPALLGLGLLADLRHRPAGWRGSALLAAAAALLLGLLLFWALFPAMWANPLGSLQTMTSYTLGSAEGEHSGPLFFLGQVYPDGELGSAGWLFYLVSFVARSTPLVLLGLGLAAWFGVRQPSAPGRATAGWLALGGLGFLLLMTIASKKMDRYGLPALPFFILIAGWGWAAALQAMGWRGRQVAAVAGLLVAALLSALPNQPYFLNYYNPLIGPADKVMMIGWGEGLDQAAQYLSRQPGIAGAGVATWYSVSFQWMYSYPVEDIPITSQLSEAGLADLLSMDYLVIYVHQWQRGTPQNLLDALAPLDPQHSIWIGGQEYVRVYRLGE